ncbi:MAG: hypothetical protein DRQ61_11645 [Gammaproteobacteria bacterium]|nr:MAG: hypothetical protein DRQ61_11645 [Gammaproteobacteria bacterium]
MKIDTDLDTVAWYRQFWPWFIIFFPAAAVVGGISLLITAINSPNPMVEGDYYKAGLAINKVIEREELAASLKLRAYLNYQSNAEEMTVEFLGDIEPPALLSITFSHPTREIFDRRVTLSHDQGRSYFGPLELPIEGNWDIAIEGPNGRWIVKGRVRLPAAQPAELIAN